MLLKGTVKKIHIQNQTTLFPHPGNPDLTIGGNMMRRLHPMCQSVRSSFIVLGFSGLFFVNQFSTLVNPVFWLIWSSRPDKWKTPLPIASLNGDPRFYRIEKLSRTRLFEPRVKLIALTTGLNEN